MPQRRKMLSNTASATNNNKFYEVTLDGNVIRLRWGRIPADSHISTYTGGQSKTEPGGSNPERKFESIVRKKLGRGYSEVQLIDADPSQLGRPSSESIRSGAHLGLAAPGADVAALVDRLVDENAHAISARSGGMIQAADGVVRTALGVVTKDTVVAARQALARLENAPAASRNMPLDAYLRLIPQKVPSKRGWHETFLSRPEDLASQRELLDDLESSVDFCMRQAGVEDEASEALSFRYRLAPVSDPKVLSEITSMFESSKNSRHHWQASQMRLAGVWRLTDESRGDEVEAALARVGNVRRMWHGTRISNLLSILSSGFVVVPSGAAHTAGRMFGHGIYHSEQSTKSLNYSRGFWTSDRGQRVSSAFMLVDDVAMGKPYLPTGGDRGGKAYRGGYDSIDVRPGSTSVINHEAIVWNLDQIAPRYLCEFVD